MTCRKSKKSAAPASPWQSQYKLDLQREIGQKKQILLSLRLGIPFQTCTFTASLEQY
jgi:hypothetical protein